MNYKFFVLSIALGVFNYVHASSPNVCDELEEAGDSSSEQIASCRTKIGVSEYYKAKELKRQSEEAARIKSDQAAVANQKEAAKKSENIETKKFTSSELLEAGFGKPFFAVTDDYRYSQFEQVRITEGNSLCSYLGYEKAIKSVISPELNQQDSDRKGLMLEKGIFGAVKQPTLYKQDNPKIGVRKYVEITCVRRKDKKADVTNDALKSAVEELEILPDSVNPSRRDSSAQISTDKRSTKKESTPHGYTTPEWMRDNTDTSTPK
jgi:hypothetical protein